MTSREVFVFVVVQPSACRARIGLYVLLLAQRAFKPSVRLKGESGAGVIVSGGLRMAATCGCLAEDGRYIPGDYR